MRRHRWVAVGIGAVGLGLGLGTAAQAATSPGLVYSGNTSQKVPMYIRLNLARTKIASTSWRWNAPCTLGSAATADTSPALRGSEVPWTNIPVSSTGAWKIAVTQRWVYGTTHYVGTYRVYGKRVGDTMQGTIKATLVERNSAGALIATCISPLIRFSLGNTRRYGGPSGQGRPMAASLSVDRRKARLDWSWKAKCTDWTGSTSRTYIEGFDKSIFAIPVSSTGVWKSGAYTSPDSVDDGIRYRWSYTLTARTLANSVTGAFSGTLNEFDAVTGKLRVRCKSGAVSFNLPS